MTWWQNDPVASAPMDTAKATAGWWSNDPVAEQKVKVPEQDPRITALQEPGGAQRLLRGVPVLGGALDEIGAGADAALDYVSGGRIGEPYDVGLERRRQAIRKSDAENPVRNTVEAVAGGVVSAAALPYFRPFGTNTGGVISSAANGGVNALLAAAPTAFTEGEGGFENRLQSAQDVSLPAIAFGTALGGAGQVAANRYGGTPQNSVTRDAQNLDIELPQFMEGYRPTESIAAKMGAIPFVGDDINRAVGRARTQTAASSRTIANAVSPANVQDAGDNVRNAMTARVGDGARAAQDRVYAPVNQAMQNVVAPLNGTRQAAATLAAQQDAAASPLHQRAIAEVADALNRPQGLSFDGITRLRTRIGAMIDNGVDPENRTARAGLQAIYAGLTQDMEAAVTQQGGARAQALWQRANAVTRQIAERRDVVARIVGTDGDRAGEGIVDRIISLASTKSTADAARLGQARRAAGADAWRDLSANAIGRLGRNQSNEFSPDIFLKNFRQLSDEGRRVLFQSTGEPGLLLALQALANVSSRLQRFNKLGNPSGTGGVTALVGALGAVPYDGGITLATALGTRGIGALMSRPAIVRNVTAHAQAMERFLNGRMTRAAISVSAARLADAVSKETGEEPAAIRSRIEALKP